MNSNRFYDEDVRKDDQGDKEKDEEIIDTFDILFLDYRKNYYNELNNSINRHVGYHIQKIIPIKWEHNGLHGESIVETFVIHYVKNKPNDEEKKPVENMDTFVDIVSGDTDGALTNSINNSIREHGEFIIAELKPIGESRILIQYQRKKEGGNTWKWKSSI